MKKTALNFWIVLSVLIISSTLSQSAHAYLVPLIGGIGWLLAAAVGGILVAATFIWMHIKMAKEYFYKKKSEKSIVNTDKTTENDGNS